MPGRAQRADPGQEGLSDAQHDPLHQDRRRGRHGRPARGAVRGARQRRPSCTRPSPRSWPAAGPARTTPRRAARSAAAARKPYRQKGTGRARQGSRTRAALRRRRRRLRAASAQLRAAPAQAHEAPRAPVGALTAKFGDGAIKVVDDLAIDAIQDPRAGRLPRRAQGQRPRARRRGRARTSTSSSRPATCPASRSSAPTRSTSSTSSTPTCCSSPQPSLADDGGGVRMTLLASQIVLRPVISEKSMDETQRGKYTFARPRRRQQAPDQGSRRGALQGHGAGRQRPDHEGQGEDAATARRGRQSRAAPRPGRRPS